MNVTADTTDSGTAAPSDPGAGGTSAPPAPTASLSFTDGQAYSFGSTHSGIDVSHTFTVTNSGNASATSLASLSLGSPFSFPGGSFPGTGGSCGATLAAGASCTLVLRYSASVVGLSSTTFSLGYNNGVSSQSASIALSGTTIASASLTFEAGKNLFGSGTIGSTGTNTILISNVGTLAATGIAPTGLTSGDYSYTTGSYPGTAAANKCGTSLGPSSTCLLSVSFSPQASGARADTLTLLYNNGIGATNASVALAGTGLTAAHLVISPSGPYDYGSHVNGVSTDATFTLTNTGQTTAASLTPAAPTGAFSFKGGSYPGSIASTACGSSLAPGASCLVVVTYAATSGLTSSAFSLTYGTGVGSAALTQPLQGTGVLPASLAAAPSGAWAPTGSFGNQAVGYTSASQMIVVTNTGGIAAGSIAVTGMGAPFAPAGTGGTCGGAAVSLAPGASCTILVTFHPSAATGYGAPIGVVYDRGDGTILSASTPVTGTGILPATLAFSPGGSLSFGNVKVVGGSGPVTQTVTISNVGALAASGITPPTFTGPFRFTSGAYPGTGPTGGCGANLAAGASCTVSITFNPKTVQGFSDSLSLYFGDGVGDASAALPLAGTGVFKPTWLAPAATGPDVPASYGTLGIAATGNTPPSRLGALSISDGNTLWVFGGKLHDNTTYYNDLWSYDIPSGRWTWVSGGNLANQSGSYSGTQVPGARAGAVGWRDSSGNLWVFGGYGYDDTTSVGLLSDLWKYNKAGGTWTYVSGGVSSHAINQVGCYNAGGAPCASALHPGGRERAVSWYDGTNFWLFGGLGCDNATCSDSEGSGPRLNDLWKFNGTSWSFVGGTVIGTAGVRPGTVISQGSPSAGNVVGGRFGAAAAYDGANLWLFGGQGVDTSGNTDDLNDLWKWDGTYWTFVSGSSLAGDAYSNHRPVYGTQGTPNAANVPGGRYGAAAWVDGQGNFFVFGGQGYGVFGATATWGDFNDLWRFDGSNWTWMAGQKTATVIGVYGTRGIGGAGNMPGSRWQPSAFKDASGSFYLFGGTAGATDASYNYNITGEFSDLWSF